MPNLPGIVTLRLISLARVLQNKGLNEQTDRQTHLQYFADNLCYIYELPNEVLQMGLSVRSNSCYIVDRHLVCSKGFLPVLMLNYIKQVKSPSALVLLMCDCIVIVE